MSAQSDDDYEETQTDSNGEYRLRGLAPGKKYKFLLKGGSDGKFNVKYSVPEHAVIDIGKEDVHDVNFIAFVHSNFSTIGVSVNAPKEFLSTLKLELMQSKGSGLVSFKEITVHSLNYFEFSGVPLGQYVLKLSSSLPKNQYRYTDVKENVNVDVGDTSIQTSLSFDIQVHDNFTESTVFPFPFLFVLLGFVYCAYHYKEVYTIIQNPNSFFEEKKIDRLNFLPDKYKNTAKKQT